jgi:hypothetical protein
MSTRRDKVARCLGVKTLLLFSDDYQDVLEVSTSWSPEDMYRHSFVELLKRNKPELLPYIRLPDGFMVQKKLTSFLGSLFKR